LFASSSKSKSSKSALANPDGYPASGKWRKLRERVPEHERSNVHRECYLAWRELERRLKNEKGIDSLLKTTINLKA